MKKNSTFVYQDTKARGDMYSFLSSVYLLPPTQEILQHFVSMSFLEEISLLFGEKAILGLRKFASNVNIDKDLELLKKEFMDLQPGDVPATYADVDDLVNDVGFKPATPLKEGIQRFVEWYKGYYC